MKNKITLLGFFLTVQCVMAQKWTEGMQRPDGNLYQIQADFEKYWSTRDINEKGKGYKTFKRWEAFAEPRVYPSGDLYLLNQTGPNFEAFLKTLPAPVAPPKKALGSSNNSVNSSTWVPMGPIGPIGPTTKSGRLNFLTIDPTNTLNLWVGAPAGGLWRTTNGGSTWSTNTDQLSVVGCSDLAIDPTNTNIMYLATGDGDAGDTRSIGVLKSTDGGQTWNPTGLTAPVANYFLMRRLIINPSNPQILLAATNTGIYRTTDAGVTWSVVSSSNAYDLEFKPGDPNTVYAGGNSFRMSTNGGASFFQVTNGISGAGFERSCVAVTPADPNYVYVLASDPTNSGFLGLYKSTTSGSSFTVMSNGTQINILGSSNNGTDVGGNGWYDLALAASPLNAEEIVTGGVNTWRSNNGGTNWGIIGHWTATGAPFIHADHHDLEYAPDGTLFSCNDGTIYRRSGNSWIEISGLMNISQIYKMGLSGQTVNRWITGHQDNGTNINNGTTYSSAFGGDGMDCFIDRTNDQNCFGESQNGNLRRSLNGGSNWATCSAGLPATRPWVTVWKQDPQNAQILYVGVNQMYVSTTQASGSWTQLSNMPSSAVVNEFAIAPSNNQVIYVVKNSGVYKTTDAGNTWTTVTNGIPVGSAAPTFITIHPTDPNTAWVTLSGYSAGNKIYMTTNGGSSWVNWSANLPNLPANCSIYEPGSNNMIYVGMDVGIYYRNATSLQWTLYNAGLPNVPIRDFEMSPANPGVLYAATYGRGVWSANVYAATAAPSSSFVLPTSGLCMSAVISFTDMSDNLPTSWSWSVSPSAGVVITSPTSQNPSITFPSPGNYTVSLQATNNIGQGSVYTQVVSIATPPTLIISAVTATAVCRNQSVVFTGSGASTYSWSSNGGSAATTTMFPIGNVIYTLTGTSNSCSATKTIAAYGIPLPQIVLNGPLTICIGDQVNLVATGADTYTWNTTANGATLAVNPTANTSYSIEGTDVNGCKSTAFFALQVSICEGIGGTEKQITEKFVVFPNPAKNKIEIRSVSGETSSLNIQILDVSGREVLNQQIAIVHSKGGEIDITSLPSGSYIIKVKQGNNKAEQIRLVKE